MKKAIEVVIIILSMFLLVACSNHQEKIKVMTEELTNKDIAIDNLKQQLEKSEYMAEELTDRDTKIDKLELDIKEMKSQIDELKSDIESKDEKCIRLQNEKYKLVDKQKILTEQVKELEDKLYTPRTLGDTKENRFNPVELVVGDVVKGMTVVYVQNNWDSHEGTYIVRFNGTTIVKGKFINYGENSHVGKIFFTPDKDSLANLPMPVDCNQLGFFIRNENTFESLVGTDKTEGEISITLGNISIGTSKDKPWVDTGYIIDINK